MSNSVAKRFRIVPFEYQQYGSKQQNPSHVPEVSWIRRHSKASKSIYSLSRTQQLEHTISSTRSACFLKRNTLRLSFFSKEYEGHTFFPTSPPPAAAEESTEGFKFCLYACNSNQHRSTMQKVTIKQI